MQKRPESGQHSIHLRASYGDSPTEREKLKLEHVRDCLAQADFLPASLDDRRARPSIFSISIPPSRPVLSVGSRTCGTHTR
jgi:hypothetical protein